MKFDLGHGPIVRHQASEAGAVIGGLLLLAVANAAASDQVFSPPIGGTLVDGGTFGEFDGIADAAYWTFNGSSNEGAITVSRDTIPGLESRLVFEFDLRSLASTNPRSALLHFQLRGAPRFPADPTLIDVVAYPADLHASLSDFSAGPSTTIEEVSVAAFQPSTLYEVDVSEAVAASLAAGRNALGIRLQVSKSTSPGQTFMDALETDPTTKPSLVVDAQAAGDFNGDGHINLADFAHLPECLSGPRVPALQSCLIFDFDGDLDVDLSDVQAFELRMTN